MGEEIIDFGNKRAQRNLGATSLEGLVRGNEARAEKLLEARAQEILNQADGIEAYPKTPVGVEALKSIYEHMNEWVTVAEHYLARNGGVAKSKEFKRQYEEMNTKRNALRQLLKSLLKEYEAQPLP